MVVAEKALLPHVDIQRKNVTRHPDTEVYRHDFTALGGWTTSHTGTIVDAPQAAFDSGTSSGKALHVERPHGTQPVRVSRTLTGLVVGGTYTLTARLITDTPGWYRLKLAGQTQQDRRNIASNIGWFLLTQTFTATATSQAVVIEGEYGIYQPGDLSREAGYRLDFVSLTRMAHEQVHTPEWITYIADATELHINRGASIKGLTQETDVGITSFTLLNREDPAGGSPVLPGDYIRAVVRVGANEAPLFTGKLWDVQANYSLDKGNGAQRTYVTFTILDAVEEHEKTRKGGIRIEMDENLFGRSETFDERMERLQEASRTPVALSTDGWNPDGRKVVWRT